MASEPTYVETLGNMALLEKSLNRDLEDKPFNQKASTYGQSVFDVTSSLKTQAGWTKADVEKRAKDLAALAPQAWPL